MAKVKRKMEAEWVTNLQGAILFAAGAKGIKASDFNHFKGTE